MHLYIYRLREFIIINNYKYDGLTFKLIISKKCNLASSCISSCLGNYERSPC
jgi:hypothetical protein